MFHRRLHPVRKQNFKVYHLRYASKIRTQCLTTVKLPGSFRLAAGKARLHAYWIFTGRLVETVLQSLSHSCGPELTRQGITLPLDGYSYRRRSLALHPLSLHLAAETGELNVPALVRLQPLYLLLRVKQGPVFLINSR